MKPIAAIWHHPGTPPTGAGAGEYQVAILAFLIVPGQMGGGTLRAVVADSGGRLNTAAVTELEVRDPSVREAVALTNPGT